MLRKTASSRAVASSEAGSRTQSVRSVERVSRMMEALFTAPEGRTLTDLSRELGLHKTTVLRLLRTLVSMNVVVKDKGTDRYFWDPMIWLNIVMKLRRSWSGVDALQSLLEQFAQTVGESIGLGIPDLERRRMLLAAWALSSNPIRVHLSQFPVMPMHALSAGKCYLAGMTDQELQAWLRGGLERVTDQTITSSRQLLEDVTRTRERGYALSRGESVPGAGGLAVPLKDAEGRVIAALGITAPVERMTEANIKRWLPILRSQAEQVSHQLATLPGALPLAAPNPSEPFTELRRKK